MKHKWIDIKDENTPGFSNKDIYQICNYGSGGCGMYANIKSDNWQRVRDSGCIGNAPASAPSGSSNLNQTAPWNSTDQRSPEVVVRPGDKVTHGVQANVYTVVSCQDYMQNGGRKKPPPGAILVKSNISGTYFNWRYSRSTFLNGKLVTRYEDTSYGLNPPAPIAEFALNPAPKLEHREPNQDDDGMVIGWDGRKVWL